MKHTLYQRSLDFWNPPPPPCHIINSFPATHSQNVSDVYDYSAVCRYRVLQISWADFELRPRTECLGWINQRMTKICFQTWKPPDNRLIKIRAGLDFYFTCHLFALWSAFIFQCWLFFDRLLKLAFLQKASAITFKSWSAKVHSIVSLHGVILYCRSLRKFPVYARSIFENWQRKNSKEQRKLPWRCSQQCAWHAFLISCTAKIQCYSISHVSIVWRKKMK